MSTPAPSRKALDQLGRKDGDPWRFGAAPRCRRCRDPAYRSRTPIARRTRRGEYSARARSRCSSAQAGRALAAQGRKTASWPTAIPGSRRAQIVEPDQAEGQDTARIRHGGGRSADGRDAGGPLHQQRPRISRRKAVFEIGLRCSGRASSSRETGGDSERRNLLPIVQCVPRAATPAARAGEPDRPARPSRSSFRISRRFSSRRPGWALANPADAPRRRCGSRPRPGASSRPRRQLDRVIFGLQRDGLVRPASRSAGFLLDDRNWSMASRAISKSRKGSGIDQYYRVWLSMLR